MKERYFFMSLTQSSLGQRNKIINIYFFSHVPPLKTICMYAETLSRFLGAQIVATSQSSKTRFLRRSHRAITQARSERCISANVPAI